jgi:hypothetical protein
MRFARQPQEVIGKLRQQFRADTVYSRQIHPIGRPYLCDGPEHFVSNDLKGRYTYPASNVCAPGHQRRELRAVVRRVHRRAVTSEGTKNRSAQAGRHCGAHAWNIG